MQLNQSDLCHSNTVTHEGKILIVATDRHGELWYAVKQDGFESSYLTQSATERTGWEAWQKLELPDEDDDISVLDVEKRKYTNKEDPDRFILQSCYRSKLSAPVPVQLVSALGHVYVFRQSSEGRLWVDRFVLDGLTNTLGRKIEVRFKRSRQKYQAAKSSDNNRLFDADSLDFTDITGKRFYEPTTELSMIDSLHDGWFSVVLLPTNEQERHRWHIFAYNSGSKQIELVSLLASEEGLFEVEDHIAHHPIVRKTSAVRCVKFDLGAMQIMHGLTATRYDVQKERETDGESQLLKEAIRVMLVAGTSVGNVIALNFAVALDGSLSRISSDEGSTEVWRSDTQQVLLPSTVLDEIKAISDSEPPPDGIVKSIERGKGDSVVVGSKGSTGISDSELTTIKISSNPDRNKLYTEISKVVDEDTFDVKPVSRDNGLWEVVPEEQTGLVFNGAVTGYKVMANGDLRITAINHGLTDDDSVQIVDTESYNGSYAVTRVDSKTFTLDGLKWRAGTVVSAKLQSQKRRGVLLGERNGTISIPAHQAPQTSLTFACWIKSATATWMTDNPIVSNKIGYQLQTIKGSQSLNFQLETDGVKQTLQAEIKNELTQWNHVAAVYDGKVMTLIINGKHAAEQECKGAMDSSPVPMILGTAGTDQWTVQLAEVNLWDAARTEDDIRANLYLPLTGQEPDLIGYWRLDAIVEGEKRRVLDLSPNGRDGLVGEGAYLSGVVLHRGDSGSDSPMVKFSNDELFAVTERATYSEQFEFKTDGKQDWSSKVHQPFLISSRGKRSRNAQTWTEVTVSDISFTALGEGWYRASATITVPENVGLLRSFCIEQFQGDWSVITIRKHQVARVSDSLSVQTLEESLQNLKALGNSQAEAASYQSRVRSGETQELKLSARLSDLIEEIYHLRQFETDRSNLINQNILDKQENNNDIKTLTASLVEQGRLKAHWQKAVLHGNQSVTGYSRSNFKGDSFSKNIGKYSSMPDGWNDDLDSIKVPRDLQLVLFEHTSFRGGAMVFNVDHNLSNWKIPGTNTNWKNEASSYIVRTTEGGYTNLADLKSKLSGASNQIALLNKQLAKARRREHELKSFSADRDVSADLAKAEIDKIAVEKRLEEVTSALREANTKFSEVVATPAPLLMPRINSADEPLLTRGAILDFIRPGSRLQALESCEGFVHVNYYDDSGDLRQQAFDTTRDSRNSSFEQWLPAGYQHCLNLAAPTDIVTLNEPIPLNNDWTIEAWIFHPMVDQKEMVIIAAGERDRQLGIVLRDGISTLVTKVDGQEYTSGDDLNVLPAGWYHVAAVGRGAGKTASTHFYVDGQLSGEAVPIKSSQAVATVGNAMGSNFAAGKLSGLRVWDVALTAQELNASASAQLTGYEPGLLACLELDEGRATTAIDKCGEYSGVITGAQWWCLSKTSSYRPQHAIQFDGTDDYIELAHKAHINPEEMTISCWAKVTGGEGNYRSPITSRHKGGYGYMFYAGDNNTWQFWIGIGGSWSTLTGPAVILDEWVHLCATATSNGCAFYANGQLVAESGQRMVANANSPIRIGAGATENSQPEFLFKGEIGEVCLWNKASTQEEVQARMHRRCIGIEPNLVACFPMNEIISENERQVKDLVNDLNAIVSGAIKVRSPQLALGYDAVSSAEYSTVSPDRTAMMRRCLTGTDSTGVVTLEAMRVDLLDLKWIGNGQFAPTLLGYIEGAPPVPSENLTINDDYRSYISVELNLSEDVSFNWTRSQDAGLGASIDAYIGSNVNMAIVAAPLGVGVLKDGGGIRAGFKGNLDSSYQFQNSSSITSSTSLNMTDSLHLVGTKETDAHFPHLGNRFIPKNVGYALVVSALSDVFVTRLQRRGTMMGYQVMPVENMPPDVNTITFLINPAYTMNGSLDGMTGSSATSQRFHKHVPAMRSRFGSLYPASYYRLDEAYDLKQRIEHQDKSREAYFTQFNSLRTRAAAIDQNIDMDSPETTDIEVGGKIESEEHLTPAERAQRAKEREEELENLKKSAEEQKEKQDVEASKKRVEIARHIDDQSQRSHANASFASWQKKMENIQLKAGKRNIVNTYVWDADGGFRSESQSFANAAEHSIGGSFSLNAALGMEGNFSVLGAAVELTAQATVNLTQTMSKTESRSQGVNLNLDLKGVESRGVTDHNDRPLLPGEKVNRYRFMSYYLEGSTSHFNDFFDYVVDPEWLAGNSEEARALRQTEQGKANKAWRVLHRVTYVERPTLNGFGQDLRSLEPDHGSTELLEIKETVDRLEKRNSKLEKKLDAILNRLNTPA